MLRLKVLPALVLLMCLSVCIRATAVAAQDERFLSAMQDIPLMPGMTEVPEEAVVFDKPSGRIAESAAVTGSAGDKDIGRFYSLTLPQLGWTETADGAFVRLDEELRITVAPVQGQKLVRFMVTPR